MFYYCLCHRLASGEGIEKPIIHFPFRQHIMHSAPTPRNACSGRDGRHKQTFSAEVERQANVVSAKKTQTAMVDINYMTTTIGVLRTFKTTYHNGSLYLSVTPKFYTKVLHQTLNPTDELWCNILSRIKVDLV